jgi:hypothetical protein
MAALNEVHLCANGARLSGRNESVSRLAMAVTCPNVLKSKLAPRAYYHHSLFYASSVLYWLGSRQRVYIWQIEFEGVISRTIYRHSGDASRIINWLIGHPSKIILIKAMIANTSTNHI